MTKIQLEILFQMAGEDNHACNRLKTFCAEIFKSLLNPNPTFLKDLFKPKVTTKPVREKYEMNLATPKNNQGMFG